MNEPSMRNLGVATGALVAGASTLVCCALPAVLVSLGAGAVLVGLISAVPQLIWLSEHKLAVFGSALLILALSGMVLWRARRLPCPVDPTAARNCLRLRRVSAALYLVALGAYALGALFALVLPIMLDR
jgi:hypothetical protein